MVYRGSVENGVVVLDGPPLREGTIVEVEPVDDPARPVPGSGAAVVEPLRKSGGWVGDPGEVDRLLADLKREKWEEVRQQEVRREDEPTL